MRLDTAEHSTPPRGVATEGCGGLTGAKGSRGG